MAGVAAGCGPDGASGGVAYAGAASTTAAAMTAAMTAAMSRAMRTCCIERSSLVVILTQSSELSKSSELCVKWRPLGSLVDLHH